MTIAQDAGNLMPGIVQQTPAVAATLVIVWAFLRHLSDESARHIKASEARDQLFTATLQDIRTDMRETNSTNRSSDLSVASAVGDLSVQVATLNAMHAASWQASTQPNEEASE